MTVFSIIYMIRIRFLVPGELIPRYFRAGHGILVPQIEEEIAEVSKSLDRAQQYPELFFEEIEVFPA